MEKSDEDGQRCDDSSPNYIMGYNENTHTSDCQ